MKIVILLMLLLISACSNNPVVESGSLLAERSDESIHSHVIAVGKDGGLVTPDTLGNNFVQATRVSKEQRYFKNILDSIANFEPDVNLSECATHQWGKDKPISVLIYVHGGLNTEKKALGRAEEYAQRIKDSCAYPIFVNWRSGPIDTYRAHLTKVRQGETPPTAPLTSPLYFATDLLRTTANAPVAWWTTGLHSWKATRDRDWIEGRNIDLDQYVYPGRDGIYYAGEGHKDEAAFLRATKWVSTSYFKFLSTPFVYSMAKPAWDVMLRRTNTPFVKTGEFVVNNPPRVHQGALWLFLDQFQRRIDSGGLNVEITLVGHSMGAIIANKTVKHFPDLPYRNIVHMASADSFRNTLDTTVSYIDKRQAQLSLKRLCNLTDVSSAIKNVVEQRDTLRSCDEVENVQPVSFYNLVLHPKNEDREASGKGIPPSGSLLVWLDTMFTTPETIINRRAGRWDNLNRFKHMIPEKAKNHTFIKVFGMDTGPQKHGGFDEGAFWEKSYWWH